MITELEQKISIIAAIGKNREIGKAGGLLWRIPEDLKRFKEITMGHPIIMGRTTYQSIGRPLPGRDNIVVTRDLGFRAGGCTIVHSLEEAFQQAQNNNEIFIIGGGQIYQQTLPLATKLYLTLVEKEFPEADTYFPDYSEFTKIVHEENREGSSYRYKFLELEK